MSFLSMTQQQKLQQTLKMTPQLQQAIKLLQMNRLELKEAIQQEMLENPYLEEREQEPILEEQELENLKLVEEKLKELERVRTGGEPEERPGDVYDNAVGREEDWESYMGDFASSPRDAQQREQLEEESQPLVQRVAEKPTLEGHLLWQLRLSGLNEEEMDIGELIIGNLDEQGRLAATLEELAELSGAAPDKVLQVLNRVQLLDPVGVACRSLSECLEVQAREQGLDRDPKLMTIIREHLDDFEAKRLKRIMSHLKLDEEDLREYLAVIRSLDPHPGSGMAGGEPQCVSPDVCVRKVGDDFVTFLYDDGLPRLQMSPGMESKVRPTQPRDKAYCARKQRDAKWLLNSIEKRNATLLKVTESIVRHQREFFEKGPSGLKPLILNTIAADIEMHESTVSRITTNKYVATPHGLYELKYFFNSVVERADGTEAGAESVKDLIRKMIREEDKKEPLSDDAIAAELNERLGFKIARRTVGKYRTQLKIPSSSRRREFL